MTPLTLGNDYRFFVRVYTKEGNIDSDIALITLANVPNKPATKPSKVQSKSSGNKLYIEIDELSHVTGEDGGSDIVSYSLEIDDGQGGVFTSLGGDSGNNMMATSMLI